MWSVFLSALPLAPFMCVPWTSSKEIRSMTFEYAAGGLIAVALSAYLLYALLYPEKF
jgi:K+-transporting ATPase KdpF subunit